MRARTKWALILGCWAVVTLVYSSHLYVFHNLRGERTTWAFQLAEAFADFAVWAALTPLVLALAGRFPVGRERWPAAVAVHFAASLLVSLVQVFFHAVVDLGLVHGNLTGPQLADTFRTLFARTYHFGLLVYWTIAAARWAVEHYKDQQVRASRLEARLAEARLEALKMQLQPHFLFNTLHAISALMHRDVAAADRMIARLSELLRLSLDAGGAQEVSLASELELLETYVEIERIRFEDRLTVELRVAPEAREARVPNLLLQPLVENSVRHGVSRRRGPGRIEISAERSGATLELAVRDDGVGLGDSGRPGGGGIGLSNTRARLAQLYGDAHRFDLRDAPGGGVEVSIAIPFRVAGQGDGPRPRARG
jgi:signal transduction histidine kinase